MVTVSKLGLQAGNAAGTGASEAGACTGAAAGADSATGMAVGAGKRNTPPKFSKVLPTVPPASNTEPALALERVHC